MTAGMTQRELETLVSSNARWFAGVHRETGESLLAAEGTLGVTLPLALKWLLSMHGYSDACGIPSLAESVEKTLRCRNSTGLPHRYVVLDDRGDAGAVLLDTESTTGRVIWIGTHAFSTLADSEPTDDIDEFADYGSWVAHCLEDAKET